MFFWQYSDSMKSQHRNYWEEIYKAQDETPSKPVKVRIHELKQIENKHQVCKIRQEQLRDCRLFSKIAATAKSTFIDATWKDFHEKFLMQLSVKQEIAKSQSDFNQFIANFDLKDLVRCDIVVLKGNNDKFFDEHVLLLILMTMKKCI